MSNLLIKNLRVEQVGPIDLEICAGEITCLSGISGAGKSLLLRAIADIIPATGERILGEHSHLSMPAFRWRQQVALLPAETQWWYDSVGEHFGRIDDEDIERFTQLAVEKESLNWQVSRCSTGEKQRLALLRVLANKPACLLLDEPTGSMDPVNARRVENLIMDLVQQQSLPVLWVSHSDEQIARIADRHFVMQAGKLMQT